MPRLWRWGVLLPLIGFLVGCGASARVVRLDTGRGKPVAFTPQAIEPMGVDPDDFGKAVTELARDVRPSRQPLEDARRLFRVPSVRVYPVEEGARWQPKVDAELTRSYLRWCERKQQPGDCLRLLTDSAILSAEGKYSLAMALALDSVWNETAQALEDMADPAAVQASIVSSMAAYLTLWLLPELASGHLC